jgi:hypothetical protein
MSCLPEQTQSISQINFILCYDSYGIVILSEFEWVVVNFSSHLVLESNIKKYYSSNSIVSQTRAKSFTIRLKLKHQS